VRRLASRFIGSAAAGGLLEAVCTLFAPVLMVEAPARRARLPAGSGIFLIEMAAARPCFRDEFDFGPPCTALFKDAAAFRRACFWFGALFAPLGAGLRAKKNGLCPPGQRGLSPADKLALAPNRAERPGPQLILKNRRSHFLDLAGFQIAEHKGTERDADEP